MTRPPVGARFGALIPLLGLPLLLLLFLGMPGCGDDGSVPGRLGRDAGTTPPDAVGAPDTAEPPSQAPPPDPLYAAGRSALDSGYEGDGLDVRACFDEVDNDDINGGDCSDPTCANLPSCRVGRGDGCYPAGGTDTVNFGTCTDLSTCGTPFGRVGPWVAEARLHPGGTVTSHGGLVIREDLDLRHQRLELRVTFADGPCGVGCTEGASVGLTAQDKDELLASSEVQPLVAVSLSPGRDQVLLEVNGNVVGRQDYEGEPGTWVLTVRPTGVVSLGRPDQLPLRESRFEPATGVALVAYGRSTNRSEPEAGGASLAEVIVTTTACDIPNQWQTISALPVYDVALPDTPALGVRSAPSVLDYSGVDADGVPFDVRVVAYDQDGIQFARRGADPDGVVEVAGDLDLPGTDPELSLLPPPDPSLPGAVPELFLFYTDHEADDSRIGVARQTLTAGASPFTSFHFESAGTLGLSGRGDEVAFAMPSVIAVGSEYVMAVRATNGEGEQSLRVFRSSNLMDWAWFGPTQLEDLVVTDPARTSFDRDEIESPSLVVHNGAYQLYYAGRRGTRWSIGVLASEGLVGWRAVPGPVLSAQSRAETRTPNFGSLGMRSPDAVSLGGRVQVFVTGLDGLSSALGSASRATGSPR